MKKNEFRIGVDTIKIELQHMIAKLTEEGTDANAWLRTLYSEYAQFMRLDNHNIWQTGAIFAPLSISGFAGFVVIEQPQIWHVVLIGSASTALAWTWLFIAENSRALQQKNEAWLVAIQETIGLDSSAGPKLRGNFLNRVLTFKAAIQRLRWTLVVVITTCWWLLGYLLHSGSLT